MFRLICVAALVCAGLWLVSCNLDTRALLQDFDPEAGTFETVDVRNLDERDQPPSIDGGTYVGTLGPSNIGAGLYSGATFTIPGNGERVCVIVDPQSVWRDDLQLDSSNNEIANPFMTDFPHDDGDLDLLVGLASYYTGTPGEVIGDFLGNFPDSNGVERAIDLNLCLQEDYHGQVGGTAGRSTPEACSFVTLPGVDYRVVLQVYSVPIDDNELRYALEVRSGECPVTIDECTLRGDADPAPEGALPSEFDAQDVEELYCDSYL
ncbi:MAG: hypothetical protein CMP23_14255 [Rickettsiales bacterium]|nr:hypothetical protein [Rickettsiales bacterium]|tara:strand:- start:1408 stop:2199 length:792 start_codon:yes stop_codon:yes gene_type:complete